MLYKERTKNKLLLIYEILNQRTILTKNDAFYYYALKKGYEGECRLDTLTINLRCDCLILNDLLLEVNRSHFQIDALLITPGGLIIYEAKNYEGDYHWGEEILTKDSSIHIENPSLQLARMRPKLHILFQQLPYPGLFQQHVVFINPAFTLYGTPAHEPFIFPTQLKAHFAKLDRNTQKITPQDHRLAEQLLQLNQTDYPIKNIPAYTFHTMKKGVACPRCESLETEINHNWLSCKKCQSKTPAQQEIQKAITDFRILFPNERLTTDQLYQWCGKKIKRDRLYRHLAKNHTRQSGRSTRFYL